MYEEPTEENLRQLIDRIPANLNPVERLILNHYGTNQTLLSVLFMVPIKVEVISQIEKTTVIVRWVKLVAEYAPDNVQTVCLAESVIDKNTSYSGFINGIKEKNKGIGQLISSLELITKRELVGLYCDDNIFARTISINTLPTNVNDRPLSVIITEVFPKEPYKRLCKEWIPNG